MILDPVLRWMSWGRAFDYLFIFTPFGQKHVKNSFRANQYRAIPRWAFFGARPTNTRGYFG